MSALQRQPIRPSFSKVLLGPRANAESVPKTHVAFHAYHAALHNINLKIFPRTQPPPNAIQIICNVALQTHNSSLILNLFLPLPTPTFPFSPPYPLHFPVFHVISLPLPRNFPGTAWEPSGQVRFLTPLPHFNNCNASCCTLSPFFLLSLQSGLQWVKG